MNHKTSATTGWIAILVAGLVFIAQAANRDDIAKVREATAQFQRTPAALAAGYNLIPGLDYCFQNYGVGGIGYHFINVSLIDATVDLLQPEGIVYAPDLNGSIQLSAVEYIVPASAWDAEHTELPQVVGQTFHLNERLDMYVLYAWIWKNNPSGMFENWNPTVFCPGTLTWEGPRRWR